MIDVPHDGKSYGEIVARAPWLTMAYLNKEDASEQLWSGGYLHTGDVASIDADGYVYIRDRLKGIVRVEASGFRRFRSRTSSWRSKASGAWRSSPCATSSGAKGPSPWSCSKTVRSER